MSHSVLSEPRAIDFAGSDRVLAIEKTVRKRVQQLQGMTMTHCHSDALISTEDDVKENIAEDYTPKVTM